MKHLRSQLVDGWKVTHQRLNLELKDSRVRESTFKLLHSYCKQVGDTLAFLLFGKDGQKFASLSGNQPTRSLPTGYSLQAMIGVAEGLAPTAGFPILHDITNRLQVGDITFVDPDDDELLTVEIKAGQLTDIQGNTGRLAVKLYASGSARRFQSAVSCRQKGANLPRSPEPQPPSFDRRITAQRRRQLERMAFAKKLEAAESAEVYKTDEAGVSHMVVKESLTVETTNWKTLAELVAEARSKGCACRTVDAAFLYVVAYAPRDNLYLEGEFEVPFGPEVTSRLADFLASTQTPKSQIHFDTSWRHLFEDPPRSVQPLLAYPLSTEDVLDILWRRLTICVFVSLPAVIKRLAAAGIHVKRHDEIPGFLDSGVFLAKEFNRPDGSSCIAAIENIRPMLDAVTLEFASLEGFVNLVSGALDAMASRSEAQTRMQAEGLGP